MDKLGYWILDTACSDLKKTNEAGFNITLSVNISAKQLESESFLDNLQEIIEKHHLIDRYRFGLALATKSNLITRDIDLLQAIRRHSPVLIKITITTCDDDLAKRIEPNAPLSSERFAAIRELSRQGIFAGILLMPVLPFLEDNEENVIGMVRLARENGAGFIYPAFGVTLRQNQRAWYFEQLDRLFPGLKQKYLAQYGNAYECTSPKAKLLWQSLKQECDRVGILYRMPDIIKAYQSGYGARQPSLF